VVQQLHTIRIKCHRDLERQGADPTDGLQASISVLPLLPNHVCSHCSDPRRPRQLHQQQALKIRNTITFMDRVNPGVRVEAGTPHPLWQTVRSVHHLKTPHRHNHQRRRSTKWRRSTLLLRVLQTPLAPGTHLGPQPGHLHRDLLHNFLLAKHMILNNCTISSESLCLYHRYSNR